VPGFDDFCSSFGSDLAADLGGIGSGDLGGVRGGPRSKSARSYIGISRGDFRGEGISPCVALISMYLSTRPASGSGSHGEYSRLTGTGGVARGSCLTPVRDHSAGALHDATLEVRPGPGEVGDAGGIGDGDLR
jgi:hypothetical protein